MARRDYYHDPHAPTPNSIVVAVTAFVQDDAGRLLMIRRTDNDHYAIPGGGQEVGETLTQAVVREVEEETGMTVEVTGLIGIYSDPDHIIAYDDGEVRQEFSVCFRARPVSGELRTSTESKEVLWIASEQLDALKIHPSIYPVSRQSRIRQPVTTVLRLTATLVSVAGYLEAPPKANVWRGHFTSPR